MKIAIAFIPLIAVSLISTPVYALAEHLEYNITLNSDGSACWRIVHVSDIDTHTPSWDDFEQKIIALVDISKSSTQREMDLDVASLKMNTDIDWETSSKTNEYIFKWYNFSKIENNQIAFGDVFNDPFFADFFGDGELYVKYPQQYTISLTFPTPNEQSPQTLHWYRSQDFSTNPNIKLTQQTATTIIDNPTTLIVILTISGVSTSAIAFLMVKSKRKQKNYSTPQPTGWEELADSKEQVLQLLKKSGGSIKQSDICTNLRYSRAKTSILLSEMEKDNQVRRNKVGKNKIVYLMKMGT